MNTLLDGLVSTKNEKLSPEYKVQIAATLKRLYGSKNMQINMTPYLSQIKRKPANVESYEYMNGLKELIKKAAEILMQLHAQPTLSDDVSLYDAALATIMTSCTSRRISELHQITMSDLDLIAESRPIFIHVKGRKSTTTKCVIVPNEILMACIANAKQNRSKLIAAVNASRFSNRHPEYKTNRVHDGYLFVTSVSQLRKRLKQFAVMFSINLTNLGFNRFRKYITTLLIGGGGHTLAQFVNAHSNINMTITNYDLGTRNTMEKTFTGILDGIVGNEENSSRAQVSARHVEIPTLRTPVERTKLSRDEIRAQTKVPKPMPDGSRRILPTVKRRRGNPEFGAQSPIPINVHTPKTPLVTFTAAHQ
ncbi:MAG: tyrosine-type recombinase/integrase [Janthinobacterium lividum]